MDKGEGDNIEIMKKQLKELLRLICRNSNFVGINKEDLEVFRDKDLSVFMADFQSEENTWGTFKCLCDKVQEKLDRDKGSARACHIMIYIDMPEDGRGLQMQDMDTLRQMHTAVAPTAKTMWAVGIHREDYLRMAVVIGVLRKECRQEVVNQSAVNIMIHRGANQIGGCITEIATKRTRIIIDLGSNLPGSKGKELTVQQVAKLATRVDAIFYTHLHEDHIGLFAFVPKKVPQYIGNGALEMLQCKYRALEKDQKMRQESTAINSMNTYQPNESIMIGDIQVTPFYCSHSAFDSYMFKIDTQGKVILHTGDFRRHGYLGKSLENVLERYVGQIDVLITEGTTLSRQKGKVLTENDIKKNTKQVLNRHKYVFALSSSTNFERMASFYMACKETKLKHVCDGNRKCHNDESRKFVCDGYQKSLLDICHKYAKNKKVFGFNDIFTYSQRGESDKVKRYLRKYGFLCIVRASQFDQIKHMMTVYNDEPAYLIYSMWQGYYNGNDTVKNPKILQIRSLFGDRIFDGTKDGFHTSGHADPATLRNVCMTTHPTTGVVFIHKEACASPESLQLPSEIHVVKENETRRNISFRFFD